MNSGQSWDGDLDRGAGASRSSRKPTALRLDALLFVSGAVAMSGMRGEWPARRVDGNISEFVDLIFLTGFRRDPPLSRRG